MAKNSEYLSLNEAAKKVKKSPSTIHKYLNNGTLSYVSKIDNVYQIDPAELGRVFPDETTENIRNEQSRMIANGGEKGIEYKELEHQLELIRNDLKHETRRADKAEEREDKLQKSLDEALDNQKLLAPQNKDADRGKNFSSRDVPEASKQGNWWPSVAIVALVILTGVGVYFFGGEHFELNSKGTLENLETQTATSIPAKIETIEPAAGANAVGEGIDFEHSEFTFDENWLDVPPFSELPTNETENSVTEVNQQRP